MTYAVVGGELGLACACPERAKASTKTWRATTNHRLWGTTPRFGRRKRAGRNVRWHARL